MEFTFFESIDLSLIRLIIAEQRVRLDGRDRNVTPSSCATSRRSGTCICSSLSCAASAFPPSNKADNSSKTVNASPLDIVGTSGRGLADPTTRLFAAPPLACCGIAKTLFTCRSILCKAALASFMLFLISSISLTRRASSSSLLRKALLLVIVRAHAEDHSLCRFESNGIFGVGQRGM